MISWHVFKAWATDQKWLEYYSKPDVHHDGQGFHSFLLPNGRIVSVQVSKDCIIEDVILRKEG